MKSRPPYRSPFWTPEVRKEVSGSSVWDIAALPIAPQPESQPRVATPSRRTTERAIRDRANDYAQSDLVLFGRLMDFSNRGQIGKDTRDPSSLRPHRGEDPVQSQAPAARAGNPQGFTSGDLALFQGLQPAPSSRQPPQNAAHRSPSTQSAVSTRSYSQADLDAFGKLTRFGRSG